MVAVFSTELRGQVKWCEKKETILSNLNKIFIAPFFLIGLENVIMAYKQKRVNNQVLV